MYIEAVPNRNSPPAILLRESYRDNGKVKKRTILNLSNWPPELIEGFKALLKGSTVSPAKRPVFTIKRLPAHGHDRGQACRTNVETRHRKSALAADRHL